MSCGQGFEQAFREMFGKSDDFKPPNMAVAANVLRRLRNRGIPVRVHKGRLQLGKKADELDRFDAREHAEGIKRLLRQEATED